ncbi:helix-turn-helix domain-containing protein [Actinokineospora auranticolor]|uniref:AcrR family transcriptional regulator n=1 Tax=Actinokineospora auranticolor TaxID=155976 RepID=A0A2S6GUP3_9PSEU|nr:TetR/AcrR family transcriptional regulator [Actinokineospora auranticolor]PPK68913.1 AcrR family transcriptional regulator [Actinokineospora auranticolor]
MSDPATEPTDPAEPRPTRRRTQRERREATVAKLVDATIAAISEVGYARASVQEICRRAGVSHGGLFRHFDTRLDLVVTVAEEVGRRQSADFLARVGPYLGPEADPDPRGALRAVREAARAPLNIVWFELLLAARTDADLRARLQPTITGRAGEIDRIGLRVPAIAAQPEQARLAALSTGLRAFDGEALLDAVHPRPDLDEQRVEQLARFYAGPPGSPQ